MVNENELFDILTPEGERTGTTKPRCEVHRDGDWHGSVHIWVLRRRFDGTEILMQKRAAGKDSNPNCYDAAATGHIDAGEDALAAAVRELYEEMGIHAAPSDLLPVIRRQVREDRVFHGKRFLNNEINSVYLLTKAVSDSEIRFEEEEISAVEWQPYEKLEEALTHEDPRYCVMLDELREVMRAAENLQ
ncbi:MAG: NUDIX domain-containing protein [Oscillospiraceae bacterium]